MDVMTMSGLQVVEALAAGRLPAPTMAATVPMDGIEAEHGRVRLRAQADGRHINPMGGVHGGFAATVLDTATGLAVHTTLEAGISYATVDLAVKMLRPVPQGLPLVAEAHVTHAGRSIVVAEGTLRSGDGRLLASASATCFVKRG